MTVPEMEAREDISDKIETASQVTRELVEGMSFLMRIKKDVLP